MIPLDLTKNKLELFSTRLSVPEFLIFKPKHKTLDFLPTLNLDGKRIYPSQSVKYLGVYLDENLCWKPHVNHIASKLQRANGALSKIRHYVPHYTLLNIYHSIFSSHMRYACQVWGLRDTTTTHRILTLQKSALRLISFNQPRAPSSPIFANLDILNFFDLVKVLNIQFVHKFLNSELPSDTLNTLAFNKISHYHSTRSNFLGLLIEPLCQSKTFGCYSFRRLAILQWNSLQRLHPNINLSEAKPQQLKSIATKHYLNSYLD